MSEKISLDSSEFINLISKRHFLFGGAVLFFHITCRVLAMGGIFSTEL